MPRSTVVAPVRVFLVVIVTVFTIEAMIMLGPVARHPFSLEAARSGLIDAMALITVLCPVLWLLVVRPLRVLLLQRGQLLQRVFEVQEEERARLARDLHDEIGQAQTAVLLGLRSLLAATTLEQAKARAQSVYDISTGAIDATRRLSRGLSPVVLTDFGLAQALECMCADMRSATGASVDFSSKDPFPRLRPDTEIALYRVAQEALTNAVRHAHATKIAVDLSSDGDSAVLRVSDNGVGMPGDRNRTTVGGLGLAGMRERVALMNGRLAINSSQSTGTAITISVPLRIPAHE